MAHLSRLEKTLHRLMGQHASLAYAFGAIAGREGVVLELGLGLGRTYDHLRHHLPEREIYAFDRANGAYAECQPEPGFLILGEIEETLPAMTARLGGRVVLAHVDLGSFDKARNRAVAAMVARLLPPLLAPGALILSDLDLPAAGFTRLPLPSGAPEGSGSLYRAL